MEQVQEKKSGSKYKLSEGIIGIVLCIVGAFNALAGVYGGRCAYEWLYTSQKSSEAYHWYQAKAIRATLLEGQSNLIQTLINANTLTTGNNHNALLKFSKNMKQESGRLEKEKNEILKGSRHLGKANWVQEINNQYGIVIGANEWSSFSEHYGKAAEILDMATTFLELALVAGAVALLMEAFIYRLSFFLLMLLLNFVGLYSLSEGYLMCTSIIY